MAVDSVVANAASQVTGAIQQAARSTGTSFEYLLTTARIESNLNPAAKAPTTSASGLYQFIDQTWLATVKEAGPSHGLGRYAAAIVPTLDGHFDVPDPAMRDAIMKLRADPTASAVMAGAFTRTNSALLSSTLGRAPTEGELYIAHFLGRDGATKLVSAAASTPQPAAADLFPQAASANKSIFYDRLGRARSASDVYGILTSRYEGARATSFAPNLRAAVTQNAARPAALDPAGVTQAYVQADDLPPLPDTKPLFQAMFTDRVRPGAVSQTVSNLWAPQPASIPAKPQPVNPLELFTDPRPTPTKLSGGKS
jgi:hypothetical protein